MLICRADQIQTHVMVLMMFIGLLLLLQMLKLALVETLMHLNLMKAMIEAGASGVHFEDQLSF
jgi:hypothetical protein